MPQLERNFYMIKNQFISLDPSSNLRTDALNSIKYTLLLDYKVPDIAIDENLIPEIMKSCHECCRGLFQDNSTTGPIDFNFFGTPYNEEHKSETKIIKDAHNLCFLDYFSPNKEAHPHSPEIGFPTMILDHCVLSCYHAVITDLLREETVTAYEIKNGLECAGIHSLYKKKHLNFKAKNILIKNHFSSTINSKKSSSASDLSRIIKTHLNVLPYTKSLFLGPPSNHNTQNSYNFFLQFSGIFSHICKIPAPHCRVFSSGITNINEKNKNTILQNFEQLSSELFPKIDKSLPNIPEHIFKDSFHDTVDGIYHYHIMERMFNCNLIYCLLRNIHRIEKNTDYRLCQKEILDTLSLCQKLPNTFSRQYFLQYAFDKLITRPISYCDFWHDHQLDMSTSVLESPSKSKTHFQLTRWIEQFSLFCNYIGEYVIPIYEWCFTNMILEVIEQKIPYTPTKKDDLRTVHILRLQTALDSLAKYIERHYKQILRPIEFPIYQDTLDLITKHKRGLDDLNFSTDFLQQLFEVFYSPERDLDLNLPHLNPNFFLSGKNASHKNEKHIRNFYINLLNLD